MNPDAELKAICQQLSSKTKWDIIIYLYCARYATVAVISRKLSLHHSTVSKALRTLTDVKLLSRWKVRSTYLYELNEETWFRIGYLLHIRGY